MPPLSEARRTKVYSDNTREYLFRDLQEAVGRADQVSSRANVIRGNFKKRAFSALMNSYLNLDRRIDNSKIRISLMEERERRRPDEFSRKGNELPSITERRSCNALIDQRDEQEGRGTRNKPLPNAYQSTIYRLGHRAA